MKMRLKSPILVIVALGTMLFTTSCELNNNPPTISIEVENDRPLTGSTQTFSAVAEDPDENAVVRISWRVTAGTLASTKGEEVRWTAPFVLGDVVVTAIADDGIPNGVDSTRRTITVVNSAPEISSFKSTPSYTLMGGTVELECQAEEPDGEDLTYSFTSQAEAGSFDHASSGDNIAYWTAPLFTDLSYSFTYNIYLRVSDEQGYSATDTLEVLVYSEAGTIWVVDSDQATVTKYTNLGHLVLTSDHDFVRPRAVANNINEDYGCYVADYGAGEVVRLDANGNALTVFPSLPNTIDLAIHEQTNTLWVLVEGDSSLVVYNTREPAVRIHQVFGFFNPRTITINQSSGAVWIGDVGNSSVVQLNAIATPPDTISASNTTIFRETLGTPYLNAPTGLGTLNQTSAVLYVADMNDGEVERFTYSSVTENYSRSTAVDGFSKPYRVSPNNKGEVWVLNSDGNIHYFLESNINAAPIPIGSYSFSNPQSMAVDEETGEVWIGDNGTHQIVKVLSPDILAVVISGVDFVADIVVNR
ncbi:MAG: hypothetical protein V3W14_01905 [Candidatus Neomarinimicrobiota bacterium]